MTDLKLGASTSCRCRSAAFTPLQCRSFHSPRWVPTSSAHSRWSGLKAALPLTG